MIYRDYFKFNYYVYPANNLFIYNLNRRFFSLNWMNPLFLNHELQNERATFRIRGIDICVWWALQDQIWIKPNMKQSEWQKAILINVICS
jgi:hypothetical protein